MRKITGRVTTKGQIEGKISQAPIISGIPEAPKDGALYGRQNGVWDHVPMGTVKSVNGAVPDARGNVGVTPETIIYEDTTVAEALAGLNTALSGVYTKQEVDAKVSALYRFKGSVETVADLPAGAEVGDVYDVLESGANYAWDGEKWDHIGGLTAWGSIVGDIEEQDDLVEYLGTYMSAHNAATATKLATARSVSITSTGASLTVTTPTAPTFDGSGNLSIPITVTPPDAQSVSGNAATATKLATARSIQTNLASTAAVNFDGTANITPGVTGTLPIASGGTGQTTVALTRNALGLGNTTGALPVANGGTGLTAAPSLLTNLATTTAASPFAASPRPGVTGTLPIANGGTGQTTVALTRNALGLGNTTGALPIANGGTGATTAAAARTALGIESGGMSLSSNVTTTASTQAAITPSSDNANISNMPTVTAGLTAGTRTLQNLLQALVTASHEHNKVTISNCNCNCCCGT